MVGVAESRYLAVHCLGARYTLVTLKGVRNRPLDPRLALVHRHPKE